MCGVWRRPNDRHACKLRYYTINVLIECNNNNNVSIVIINTLGTVLLNMFILVFASICPGRAASKRNTFAR